MSNKICSREHNGCTTWSDEREAARVKSHDSFTGRALSPSTGSSADIHRPHMMWGIRTYGASEMRPAIRVLRITPAVISSRKHRPGTPNTSAQIAKPRLRQNGHPDPFADMLALPVERDLFRHPQPRGLVPT